MILEFQNVSVLLKDLLNLQPKLYVLLKYLFSKTCEFRRIWLPVSEKSNSCKGSLKRFFSAQTSHWLNIIYFNNKVLISKINKISNIFIIINLFNKGIKIINIIKTTNFINKIKIIKTIICKVNNINNSKIINLCNIFIF